MAYEPFWGHPGCEVAHLSLSPPESPAKAPRRSARKTGAHPDRCPELCVNGPLDSYRALGFQRGQVAVRAL